MDEWASIAEVSVRTKPGQRRAHRRDLRRRDASTSGVESHTVAALTSCFVAVVCTSSALPFGRWTLRHHGPGKSRCRSSSFEGVRAHRLLVRACRVAYEAAVDAPRRLGLGAVELARRHDDPCQHQLREDGGIDSPGTRCHNSRQSNIYNPPGAF